MQVFLDGAEAIVRGALAAGCNFFAGYPITPATPILLRMLQELPRTGGVGIQGEDEIASIGMCIGSAMTGAKAMTATSGPGMSLYSENIGLAIMGEVPLVIVDVMRLGPATGGATTVAQSDVQFLQWGTSGGFPMIVLCPSNVAECFALTQHAFNLAERFRSPVMLATDKEVVSAQQTVDAETFVRIDIRGRRKALPHQEFIPYQMDKLSDTPFFSPIGGGHLTRFTGSMHDERGILTKAPNRVDRTSRHLYHKIESRRDELEFVTNDLQGGAEVLVISYGITALSAAEAVRQIRSRGRSVSMLIIHSLWPVPESAILRALGGMRRLVVAELNFGQYCREVERVARSVYPCPEVIAVNRVDGELIRPEEIAAQVL